MMNSAVAAVRRFFSSPRCVFLLGLAVSLLATTIEVVRGRNTNYFDYQDSTRMFWEGFSPYTLEFAQIHGLYFLYLPVFCVLYAPVFLLPWWLGPYVWNIANYCLFALAIRWLPQPLAPYRMKIFLFLLSLLLQSIFCYQYNTVVCYIFLFAFILLEKNKPFWAVLLIMISATTKIYGAAELALLFCYPKVWRNFGYAVLCGAGLILLPLLNPMFDSPLHLYQETYEMITSHHDVHDYVGLLFATGLKPLLLPNYRLVQVSVLALLAVLFFWRHSRWALFHFRVQVLAVIMGYIILFSDSPETHTYIIAITGYLMAFWLQPQRSLVDWVLFWLLFVNFCILPTDVLCPAWLHNYIHETFFLDVYTYFVCWLRLVWWAVGPAGEHSPEEKPGMEAMRGMKGMDATKGVGRGLRVGTPLVLLLLLLLPVTVRAQQALRLTVRGVPYELKYVEGGTFMMGALPGDTLAEADEVCHRVTVGSYYIGQTEVTQQLWEAVMPKNRSKIKGPQHPVEYVTYAMCQEFIFRLNALTGRHFRLPTEAEWEYAARGGRHSKGYLYAGSNDIGTVAHTLDNTADGRHATVGSMKPNELGLYDMSGNVWEFCQDWYRKTPDSRPSSFFHVVRGGSSDTDARYCRVSNRYMYDERRRFKFVGFRLALSVR